MDPAEPAMQPRGAAVTSQEAVLIEMTDRLAQTLTVAPPPPAAPEGVQAAPPPPAAPEGVQAAPPPPAAPEGVQAAPPPPAAPEGVQAAPPPPAAPEGVQAADGQAADGGPREPNVQHPERSADLCTMARYMNAGLALVIFIVGVVMVVLAVLAALMIIRRGAETVAETACCRSAGTAGKLSSIASFSKSDVHACHGILVKPQYVVTTAHCIRNNTADSLKVTVGRSNLDGEGGVARNISDYRIHPKWDPTSWAHDEAVVKLDRPVENIKPVCLAGKGSVIPNGTTAAVYGWDTSEDLPAPRMLRAVNVTTMDHGQCKRIYRELTDDMICAVDDTGGPAICQGDSGAPLLVKVGDDLILLGSNIRGPYDCVAQNRPGVFLTHDDAFTEGAIEEMRDPPQVTQCGIRNTVPDVRVENGQVSAPHSLPWMAYIEHPDGHFYGGATLIHPSFVVSKYGWPGFFVVLGAHNRSSTSEPTQKIMIEKVYKHPNFTWPNYPYLGMKLVKLSRPAKFTKHVRPICLPKPGYVLPAGSDCLVSGWGDTDWPSYLTDVLREGSATTITTDQCRRDWADDPGMDEYITNATICTAADKTRPSWMDHGGPLSCEEKDSLINNLLGVLYKTGYRTYPSMFHDFSAHLPWINEMLSADGKVCFKKFEG